MAATGPPETGHTTCCIAGGGPAGMLLGLLLARAGVAVTVLEKHQNFLRDFRGDTIHPSTLEVLDELGLVDEFLALPHRKATRLRGLTDSGWVTVADLGRLPGKFPYIAFVPQWDFLNLLAAHGARCPGFTLRMGAEVVGLVDAGGRVGGVRYRQHGVLHELRATLAVAADGRDSAARTAAGLVPVQYGAPMDVAWFRLPRRDDDPEDTFGRLGGGHMLVLINRDTSWQMAYVIPKGGFAQLQAAGIEAMRQTIGERLPFLADRLGHLDNWEAVSLLKVQVARLRRWYRPGLVCIGDAAHAMSPIAGVGINLAVQDAVAAANLLTAPLLNGTLNTRHLAAVQRRRAFPAAVTQRVQRTIQARVIGRTLRGRAPAMPLPVRALARTGLTAWVAARFIGLGVRPEHLRNLRPRGYRPRS